VQENHYDPWGLNLVGIEKQGNPDHKFQYNGKEKQEEMGLNWMDFDFRQYDTQLGRFHAIDPLAELIPSINPYQFAFNSPINFSDPTGLFPSDSSKVAGAGTAPRPDNPGSAGSASSGSAGSGSASSSDDDTDINHYTSRNPHPGSAGPAGQPKKDPKTEEPWSLPKPGDQVMPAREGFWNWADQVWNGNRIFLNKQVNSDGILTDQSRVIAGDGPVIPGIGGAGSSVTLTRSILNSWKNVNFNTVSASIRYHLSKHGSGRTVAQYTQDALDLLRNFRHLAKPVLLKDGTTGFKIKIPGGQFGIYDSSGKIITFGYK
jgi:RHS repeat-associated protein